MALLKGICHLKNDISYLTDDISQLKDICHLKDNICLNDICHL